MTKPTPTPQELREYHGYLMAPDGRMWRSHRGMPTGEPLGFVTLGVARQAARAQASIRNAKRADDGSVMHGPPPHLVFEQEGRRFVRIVAGLDPARAGDGSRGAFEPDPIPLVGDEHFGWIKLQPRGKGALVFHAPSVAAGLFARQS
jgi:hypothetical protein